MGKRLPLDDHVIKDLTKQVGLTAGWCVVTLGLYHLITIGATIEVPRMNNPSMYPEGLLTDVNKDNWRTLFSLDPGILADTWAPLLMGVITIMGHYGMNSVFKQVTASFSRYLIWNLFMLMFGVLGYDGLLGIVVSVPVVLCCFCCIACMIAGDDSACLELSRGDYPCCCQRSSMQTDNIDVARLDAEVNPSGNEAHGWV
eukprot:GHVH01003470.1.p1 GENE.GHVH01003470.1~~GHVH01003470.1.p1  ORF type:complete len:200 (+),score=20.42 GHVH01003470.1:38-637(+)